MGFRSLYDYFVARAESGDTVHEEVAPDKPILVTEFGPEVLTASPDWPLEQIIIGDRAVNRPDILVK